MGNIQMKYIIYKYTDGNTSYYIDEPGLGWKCWPSSQMAAVINK